MLAEAGLELESVRPVVFAARMNDFASRWPMGFAREYVPTLRATGVLSSAQADEISAVLSAYEADPKALVISPGVLQMVARRPFNRS